MDKLTPRNREVLDLICREGLSQPKAAERMGISRDGVKEHVRKIFIKTGCGSITQVCYEYRQLKETE